MAQRRPGTQHPEEYREDLNPHGGEGTNSGANTGISPEDLLPISEIKAAYDRLPELDDDVMSSISVVRPGVRLEQGATYIDLREHQPREFTATADMMASDDHWYVPKSNTGYPLWNRLIGVDNPERLDESS
jgi:hypothetical protein